MLARFLRNDLALDLGSAHTRLSGPDGAVHLDVPTVVAVRTRRSGRREVIGIGRAAERMLGRTPDGIVAMRPVRASRVVDAEVATALVRHLLRLHRGRRSWPRPRLTVTVDRHAAASDIRTVRDVCRDAGAADVALTSAALAAARGAGLDLDTPSGHLVVDVGAGTTAMAVLCGGEVVTATTLDVAGDVFDGAILRWVRRERALEVSATAARAARHQLGAAADPPEGTTSLAGRCLREGVPRAVSMAGVELQHALAEPVSAIGTALRRVLEQTPPEIVSDVVDHGVILVGGGARLRNLDLALRAATGLAVLPVDEPDLAVIRGASAVLAGAPAGTGTWSGVPAPVTPP